MDKEKLLKWTVAGGVLAVFGAFLLFRFVVSGQSLHSEGVRAIERWLQYEPRAASTAQVVEVLSGRWTERPPSETDRPPEAPPFEIVSVKRHGWDGDYVVRVELRYPQGAPPGTPTVRYFRMRYSATRGWRLMHETSAFSYYLALLP